MRGGMEATGHSRWFERLLAELNYELWIGDPAKIRAARVRKQKNDREDAEHLLCLLLEDRFPRVGCVGPRLRQAVFWKLKKFAKATGGKAYLNMRSVLLRGK